MPGINVVPGRAIVRAPAGTVVDAAGPCRFNAIAADHHDPTRWIVHHQRPGPAARRLHAGWAVTTTTKRDRERQAHADFMGA